MRKIAALILILPLFLVYGCDLIEGALTSSEKKILSFKLEGVTPAITGVISESAGTITLSDVPYEAGLTALVPTITLSAGATVSPASGTAQNFTNPVTYTVTAEDGSTAIYTVTVSVGIETLSGTMSSNRTLTDRFAGAAIDYVIDGVFNVDGNALLTIDPGVIISFTGVNGWIVVGENAGLKMVGTSSAPIMLLGPLNNNNTGAWGGIEYNSSRADNLMEYVVVENAGSNANWAAVNVSYDARLSIKNCGITSSGSDGLYVRGDLVAFADNVITGCEGSPVVLENMDLASKLDGGSVLNGNDNPYVEIVTGFRDPQSADMTINKLTVPYMFSDGVYFDRKLTIAAGTTLLFDNNSFFEFSSGATLIANGTEPQPINFRHVNGTAGAWQGLFIDSNLANSMQWCVVEHGGSSSNYPANLTVYSGGRLTIQNSTLRNSTGYGAIRYNDSTITATAVSFSDCAQGNVYNDNEDTIESAF